MGNSLADVEGALQGGRPQPIVLVQGSERLLVDQAVGLLLDAAVGDRGDAMAITRLDLADSSCDSRVVLGHCRALGLFATQSAIVLRSAALLDKRTEDRDALADYAKDPNQDTVLILVAEKLKASTRLVKGLKKAGAIFTFDRLRSRDVPGWIEAEARRLGHGIDPGAAHMMGELVGNDLLQLKLVIEHLSLYVGEGARIASPAVESCLCATRHHGVFELVDAVGEGRRAAALEHLHSMLVHREPPLRILAMLIRHFRLLWQVSESRQAGDTLDEVTGAMKLHPFQAKKFWQQTRRFELRHLKLSYERLFEADRQLKSSTFEPALVLERLVMNLCGGRVKSRRVS